MSYIPPHELFNDLIADIESERLVATHAFLRAVLSAAMPPGSEAVLNSSIRVPLGVHFGNRAVIVFLVVHRREQFDALRAAFDDNRLRLEAIPRALSERDRESGFSLVDNPPATIPMTIFGFVERYALLTIEHYPRQDCLVLECC